MSKYKKGDPIEIEWIDSMSTGGWQHNQKYSDMTCKSVGMYQSEDKDRIMIAQNKSAYSYGGFMEIPKVAIKKKRKLK